MYSLSFVESWEFDEASDTFTVVIDDDHYTDSDDELCTVTFVRKGFDIETTIGTQHVYEVFPIVWTSHTEAALSTGNVSWNDSWSDSDEDE